MHQGQYLHADVCQHSYPTPEGVPLTIKSACMASDSGSCLIHKQQRLCILVGLLAQKIRHTIIITINMSVCHHNHVNGLVYKQD